MRLLFLCFLILIPLFASAATDFTLHTSAFNSMDKMPSLYTCDDKDISPELDWTGLPDKTKSLALLLVDTDANFYHWVVYNIPKEVLSFPEGITELPTGTMVGKNSWGSKQYRGPCPPKGNKHRYVFNLYALDDIFNLPEGLDGDTVLKKIQGHILGRVQIETNYEH